MVITKVGFYVVIYMYTKKIISRTVLYLKYFCSRHCITNIIWEI